MVSYWYDVSTEEQVTLFVGIDGGGTGCRVLLCDASGTQLGSGRAGSANIVSDPAAAREHVLQATQAAIGAAGLSDGIITTLSAYLGLAGANVDSAATRFETLLPFRQSHIASDAVIALHGAIGEGDGAAAIIGTGSVFIQRKAGLVTSKGGWGFVVSDLASGARLGRSLLETSLLAHEQIRPASTATRTIMERFGNNPQTLVEFAQAASPAEFGTFAPLVFELAGQKDRNAIAIIGKAVNAIEAILQSMELARDNPFCLLGGVGPNYAPYLSPHYRKLVRPPLASAVEGAAALAVRHFAGRRPGLRGAG